LKQAFGSEYSDGPVIGKLAGLIRLAAGQARLFHGAGEGESGQHSVMKKPAMRGINRNLLYPCGSGKNFKK
jgi:hypothetical protein